MLIEITLAGLIASVLGYGWIRYSDARKEWAEDEKIFCAAEAEAEVNFRLLHDNFSTAQWTRQQQTKGVTNLPYLPSLSLGATDLLLKYNPPQELLSIENRKDWQRLQKISLEIQAHNHLIAARNNFLTLYLSNVAMGDEKRRAEILSAYDRHIGMWINVGLPEHNEVSMLTLITELRDILKKYPSHRNIHCAYPAEA
jgi:hypothetical protein